MSKYHQAESLGDGSFGAVKMVYDDEGQQFALKSFDRNEDDDTLDVGTLREISILRRVGRMRGGRGHPNVMRVVDVFVAEEDFDFKLCMVMPKMNLVLSGAIEGGYLKKKQRVRVARGLLRAVAFLHDNGIMHRDIKPPNVLLTDKMHPVLADFSLAKDCASTSGQTHTPEVGTAGYIAPEVYEGKGVYGRKCDVWSAGVVILETLFKPLGLDRDKAAFAEIKRRRAKMGDVKPAHKLLRPLIDPNPASRIEAKGALNAELFAMLAASAKKKAAASGKENKKSGKENKSKEKSSDAAPAAAAPAKPPNTSPAPAPAQAQALPDKERKSVEKELKSLCETLGFTDPRTQKAAMVYYRCIKDQPITYCAILAHKLYEEELFNVEEVEEYIENFDIDEYTASEEVIFKAMDWDLTLPNP